jgi:uncharacterized protein YecE (DUF72 family)
VVSRGQLYLGTSGWAYKDWGRTFYPAKLTSAERLAYLATHFNSVEINNSFYRLPPADNFQTWHDQTPDQFKFSVKVSRLITHNHRLANLGDSWINFIAAAGHLQSKLGVYLLQFPGRLAATAETVGRVGQFARDHSGPPLAFEFRHQSWFEAPAMDMLANIQTCLVHADSSSFPKTPDQFQPGPIAYFRLHGPRELYSSSYTDEELANYATQIRAQLQAGKDTFVYFDNDVHGYALTDAERLQYLLSD